MPEATTRPESRRPAASGWLEGVDVPVTVTAGGLAVVFLLAGVLFTDRVRVTGAHVFAFIAETFGWVYVLATAGFVFFIVVLGFSRVGRLKLGNPDDKPEYSAFSWIAMMFALGVGIGLIFYGAAEPLILYANPPPGTEAAPRTDEAAIVGMQYSIFHWALHVWAFFGITGLAMAYVTHRKGRPALVTSALRPLIGDRVDRGLGRGVNTFVIVATLVGNAVTLGLGTLQVVAGLGFIAGLGQTTWLLVVVVGVLTIAFVLSATAGIGKGIQRLADFNVVLAIALLIFLLVLGPLRFILDLTSQALGAYLFNFLPMAFETGAFQEGNWMQNWTVFFWAWGISWAPYVGTFLGRISRGRTIREYVLGVLVAPSIATVVWFSVLGGTALNLQLSGQNLAAVASQDPQSAMYALLGQFPIATVTSAAVVILAAVFFVSGADAGAVVLGTFSSWGTLEPKKWITVTWGLLIGLVALVLLVVGGLDALQWAAIVTASPFVLILIAMCVGFAMDLRRDLSQLPGPSQQRSGAAAAAE